MKKLNESQMRGLKAARDGRRVHPATAKFLRRNRLIVDRGQGDEPRDWRITPDGLTAYENGEYEEEDLL